MQAPRHTGEGKKNKKKTTNWLKEGETVQERQARLPIIEVIKKEERHQSSVKANIVQYKVSSRD